MEKANGKGNKAQELVDEYKEKQILFKEYTENIRLLLENLLRKYGIQFQSVQPRTKEESSFHKKLLKKAYLQEKKLVEMNDLSGCRVLFYAEGNVEQLARVIYDEFEVVKDEVKFSPNEYNARHIVLRLKENRLSLSEYSRFRELRCEVQLTTILYHAWSEIQHDIIYKPNEQLLEFDKSAFDYIDNYFKEIMEKYLKKASDGFTFIINNVNRIKFVQSIIDPLTIDRELKSTSNYELYHFLKSLNEYVAKYAQKLPPDYKLVDALESALDCAKKNPVVDQKTIFGNLKGITYLDIADVILDILDRIRYYDVANNLRFIIELGKQKELQKKCEETLRRIAVYNIGIVDEYRFYVQKVVLDYVSEQKPEYVLPNLDLILALIKPIASLECEDWSISSPRTVTFKRGCLEPTAALESIRARYLELTKAFLSLVNKDIDRRKVLSAMFSLADKPHSGQISEDIITLLSADIGKITDFLTKYYDSVSNFIRMDIQRFVFSLERQPFKERFANLTKLKEKIDQDKNYAKFRILYGNDLGFYPNFDFKTAQEFRKQKIGEFVQQVQEENYGDWIAFFKELLANYASTGVGSYMYFAMFLRRIAEEKPLIAFKLLVLEELYPFLNSILGGLLNSPEREKAIKLLIDYSKDKTKQLATIQAILFQSSFNESLFEKVYPTLVESTDTTVLLELLRTIIISYSMHKNHKEKVTNIINKFTILNFYSWSFVYSSGDFWKELSDENIKAILENLKCRDAISYEEEYILAFISEKHSKDIIHFFHDRLELYKAKKINNPIPFEFSEIQKSLSNNYKEILPEILEWFSEEDQLANWHASKLVANIFPSFDNNLESFLLALVRKNDEKDLKIALRILEQYDGPSIHNTIKEIITLYPIDDALEKNLCRILSQIKGAVMGEYGLLDVYKLRKEETRDWLTDSSPKIKKFAYEYHKHLDKLIKYEKERADREIEFEEREFKIDHT